MILAGALANGGAIALGGALGLILGRGIPQRVRDTVMHGLGLCVLYVGISGALEGENIVIAILSIVLGAILGELIDLDRRLSVLGDKLQAALGPGDGNTFSQGFVSATLFVCVGAMAIVGSFQSGLTGVHDTLYAKSLIDGVVVLVMATTMGAGVLFSGVAVFLYEAVLTLAAQALSGVLTGSVIAEMTSVGSLLILAIGLNMLELTKIRVANLIPAAFFPILLCFLMDLIPFV